MAGNLIYHTAMHSSRELRSSSFEVRVDGRPARLGDVFEAFGEQDRLGVVMSRPCGAVGASALITATITAFYDLHRARGPEFFVYPDYYLFHVGRPLGDHARLDVWPRRKEVVVGEEPQAILEAIDDRAITRLVVEDGTPAEAELDGEVVASARGRIRTCLAYSPAGRVADADVEIASNPVTEGYVEAILDPETRIARLRAEADAAGAKAGAADARGAHAGAADASGAQAGAADASGAQAGAADAIGAQAGVAEAIGAHAAGAAAAPSDAARSGAEDGACRARIAAIESRIGEVDRDVRADILRARGELLRDGVPVETYRRIGLDEALALLASPAPSRAG
jgi:hypothetical protein